MKIIKRGLILIFAILLINIVFAATNIQSNLTKTDLGQEVPFQGYLRINFTDPQPFDKDLTFYSGSSQYKINLINILNNSGYLNQITILDSSYRVKPNGLEGDVIINFPNAMSKIQVGVDLRGGSSTNPITSSIVDVKNFSFDIEALTNIQKPSIYIGDKKVYTFTGQELNFAELNKSYLGNNNPDGSQGIISGNIYCQLVNVSASNKYNLKILASKKSNSNARLNATMITDQGQIPSGLPVCSVESPCCVLSVIQNTFSEASCTINKIIPEDRQEYLCIYATDAPDTSTNYFSIRTKNTQPVRGFVNGVESFSGNFFIYGSYMTYNEQFIPGTVKVSVSSEYINSYVHGENECEGNTVDECLLIPFKVDSKSSGNLKFKNLDVKYLASSQSLQKNSFREIEFAPQSISYNGTIEIDLVSLYDVLTPKIKGNYDYYVDFDSKTSSKIKFKVVDGPTAFITVSNLNPALNEIVNFDASRSKPFTGKNITEYNWLFGDGQNASGKLASHSYSSLGNYDVRLIVKDNTGVWGLDILTLVISNGSSNSSNDLIAATLTRVNEFRNFLASGSEQVKSTADLLGYTELLDQAQVNLTMLNSKYQSLGNNNTNLSEAEKNALSSSLLNEVSTISNLIPSGMRVDVSSFNGKINTLTQIKSCCEFTTELQKRKLLTAQEGINVNAEARVVTLILADGSQKIFTVLKKTISGNVGTSGKIYEFLPVGFSIEAKDILKGGNFSNAGNGIYGFPITTEIAYVLQTADLSKVIQMKTAIVPIDLEAVEASEQTDEKPSVQVTTECGNNICEADEDSSICPKDCSESNSLLWIILVFIVLIIGAIVYFGLFFKGGMLNKKFGNNTNSYGGSNSGAKSLFKTESSYFAVKNYVQSSLNKGLKESQIVTALRAKGWKDNQINSIIKEVRFKKGPEFKPAYRH